MEILILLLCLLILIVTGFMKSKLKPEAKSILTIAGAIVLIFFIWLVKVDNSQSTDHVSMKLLITIIAVISISKEIRNRYINREKNT